MVNECKLVGTSTSPMDFLWVLFGFSRNKFHTKPSSQPRASPKHTARHVEFFHQSPGSLNPAQHSFFFRLGVFSEAPWFSSKRIISPCFSFYMVCFADFQGKTTNKPKTTKICISPRPINSPAGCKFITKFVVHSLPQGLKACGAFEGFWGVDSTHSWLPPNVSPVTYPPNWRAYENPIGFP